ncbi:hypothetical protein BX666DRAFT_1884679 [Dichotomocladium elegans]|nr:hypothetical protein BX666DRAFT_1884679 [Dichotomocladium elegans]
MDQLDRTESRRTLSHSYSCPNIPELVVSAEREDNSVDATPPPADDVGTLNDSSDTLLGAVLEHQDAQDRHVRFQDHVVESAQLVERMLSNHPPRNPSATLDRFQVSRGNREKNTHRRFSSESDNSMKERPVEGGSVLSVLMRLEAQSRRKEKNMDLKKTRKAKKEEKWSKRPKRPKPPHRPISWLAHNHLVPSLEKRKLETPSVSRRSSVDSTCTTASQFEPITLEDRVRITFEIANILQKQEFLCKLAKSLMLYGCPAHRLEYVMRRVSETVGVQAEYVSVPNVMLMSVFDPSTHTTETHFIRQPQDFEMHKLGEVYRLERLVSHGEVSVDEALEFIDRVMTDPPFYSKWLNPLVYGLASFCGCLLFFGGFWYDALVSGGLAMILAVYELFTGRIQSFQPIWEITICIIIGFVARALTLFSFCFTSIAFSAFIVILPGYTMAIAIVELVSRQLVSGVVRMVYAIIYSFLLSYGIQMGSELYIAIDPSTAHTSSECGRASTLTSCDAQRIDQRFFFLLVPLFALTYCVYVRARPFRWPLCIIVSAVGYVVNYLLSCHAGAPSQILQVVPAFSIGLLGNLYTKLTGKLSFDAVLLGIFYLTPGSLGLKAGYGLFDSSTTDDSTANTLGNNGASFALAMIETAIGITIGLFVATLLVYPRGSQRTPLMNF